MVYTLIVMVFCILVAILILGISLNNYGLIVSMALIITIFCILLYCFFDSIKLGIKLLEAAANFVSEKPSVYLASIWVLFLSICFFIFWMVSVVAVQCRANSAIAANQSDSQ